MILKKEGMDTDGEKATDKYIEKALASGVQLKTNQLWYSIMRPSTLIGYANLLKGSLGDVECLDREARVPVRETFH